MHPGTQAASAPSLRTVRRRLPPRLLAYPALAGIACTLSAQLSAQTVFAEEDFAPGSVDSTEYVGSAGGQAATQELVGGNPGAYLRVETALLAPQTWNAHLLNAAVVDLSAGGIESIDFSIDYLVDSGIQAAGIALEQNGMIFDAYDLADTAGGWQTITALGLTSADLQARDPVTGNPTGVNPDFSIGAPDVRLGFFTANSSNLGPVVRYDNLSITVNRAAPPPPPPPASPAEPVPALSAPVLLALSGLIVVLGLLGLRRRSRSG